MINSATNSGVMLSQNRQNSPLTQNQSTKLAETLSRYDADNLSDDDAKALVTSIRELGIKAGSGLADALGAAGIDAGDLAQKAGIGGPGGPPGGKGGPGGPPPGGKGGPPPGGGQGAKGVESVDEAVVSLIKDAAEAYEASEDEESSFADILAAKLEEAGYDPSQPVVDFYA
ncbi:hypothetical protein [Puniceibacterium sediminis]|uniref:Uncharacterized protein n=1 Tax=Puniceibacterium sediminis TaxID=1608407 RepID=A0A238XQU6_9RHOB|nr:hypothetical protein [Puniceibacterium sediminis]SNR61416.1 hypothetical protein SAMN06265370_112130 [Puniceibacterium sediminis]